MVVQFWQRLLQRRYQQQRWGWSGLVSRGQARLDAAEDQLRELQARVTALEALSQPPVLVEALRPVRPPVEALCSRVAPAAGP